MATPPVTKRQMGLEQAAEYAAALMGRGDLGEAERILRSILALRPAYFPALHNLGVTLARRRDFAGAVPLLKRAVKQDPRSAVARNSLANALAGLDRLEEAIEQFERAITLKPDYAAAYFGFAAALGRLDRLEETVAALDRLIALKPDDAEAYAELATALGWLGRYDEARGALDKAIALDPDRATYHKKRADITRLTRAEPRFAALVELAGKRGSLALDEGINLEFALAKAYADFGDLDESFRYQVRANALKRRTVAYDEAATHQFFGDLAATIDSDFLRRHQGHGNPSAVPIFIVGMPRSGTTLVEQILASHPEVLARGERIDFQKMLEETSGKTSSADMPTRLRQWKTRDFERLGARCLQALGSRPAEVRRMTDKMPANFRFVGLIHSALPNARFIHVRRDAVDTCLSNFALLFNGAQPHAYDLGELGRYFRAYEKLMAHWRAVLAPGVMLEVQYEDIVADLAGQAGAILAHCGLAWNDACLAFHESKRPVRTASHMQVRQPLYRSAVGRARPSTRLIGPLLDALGIGATNEAAGRHDSVPTADAAAARDRRSSEQALAEAVALLRSGKIAGALALIDRALELRPGFVEALHCQGVALHGLNRFADALESFDRALALRPDDTEVLNNRAVVLGALGRFDEALLSYEQILRVQPENAGAAYNRGNLLRRLARREEALASYDTALALRTDFVEALYNRGNVLCALGRPAAALADYDRALALKPDFVEALNNRGSALVDLMRQEEALASFERALAIKPGYVDALSNRGSALRHLGQYAEALTSCELALVLEPEHVEALNNRGTVLQYLDRFDEAIASYDRALALKPDYTEAYSNLGNTLYQLDRPEDALASYGRALALAPGDAQAHWNASLARLLCGDFAEGWREYEWRSATRPPLLPPRPFRQPLWLGDADIAGKTILLHAEQGQGDTIQFCRYAPMVAALGARVVLEVQPSLKALLGSLAGVSEIVGRGEKLPAFDRHCPLLSLPLAFKTRLATVPSMPYLSAPPERVARWAMRLAPVTGRRVGVAWAGSATHWNDRRRSIGLAPLLTLASPRVTLVSLQKERRPADGDLLEAHPGILRLGEDFDDFADTAAVIQSLDLVIAVDTAVAHLAGAMGKPVWILLPFAPDWRWLRNRADSPWYPSAELFRQPRPGDWASAVTRLQSRLL
jgi:tetratricopeptide (TPR) repeat protein